MEVNKEQNQLGQFLSVFANTFGSDKNLLLKLTEFEIIDSTLIPWDEVQTDFSQNINNKFDLVFADLPIGMNREPFIHDKKRKVKQNWNLLSQSLDKVSKEGTLFGVIEPMVSFSEHGRYFLKFLESQGYYCNLFINAPKKILYPYTSLTPVIIGIQKIKFDKLFIAELCDNNYKTIVSNFSNKCNDTIQNGKWVDRESFTTIEEMKTENELNNLQTQYKDYKQIKLSEIAISINQTKGQFDEVQNTIYIQKVGTSRVVSSIEKIEVKHQNVIQVQLNSKIVLDEYLSLFYRSELGQHTLDSLKTGLIPTISKKAIESSLVYIPKISEQRILIHTNQKLEELQETIKSLQDELSLNPKNANIILDQFDSISGPLKKLSVEDEILSLIRKGENKTVEFKETFSKNTFTNKKDKEIEKSSLKNIVGFLNADGGTLLIGVHDNGDVVGIGDDFFVSNDKYLLHFKNAIKTKIGSQFYPLIDFDLFQVLDKQILKVECKASKRACFYNGDEFYVRTNPSTDQLVGQQLIEYVNRRFKQSN